MSLQNILSPNGPKPFQFGCIGLAVVLICFSQINIFVTSDEVCQLQDLGVCPKDTCCRPEICVAEMSPVKCCEVLPCRHGSNCPKCIDCEWANWKDCIYESCKKNGIEPEVVTGTKHREHKVTKGPGGRSCEPEFINGIECYNVTQCEPKHCPEHCQMDNWSPLDCSDKEQNCGTCVRSRKVKVHPAHDGDPCGPTDETKYLTCPGQTTSKEKTLTIVVILMFILIIILFSMVVFYRRKSQIPNDSEEGGEPGEKNKESFKTVSYRSVSQGNTSSDQPSANGKTSSSEMNNPLFKRSNECNDSKTESVDDDSGLDDIYGDAKVSVLKRKPIGEYLKFTPPSEERKDDTYDIFVITHMCKVLILHYTFYSLLWNDGVYELTKKLDLCLKNQANLEEQNAPEKGQTHKEFYPKMINFASQKIPAAEKNLFLSMNNWRDEQLLDNPYIF